VLDAAAAADPLSLGADELAAATAVDTKEV
jgi:hypothetical protein